VKEAPGLPAVEGKQQGVLEAAAARSVGRRQLGLRLDIWVHHLLAVAAMFIVLQSGEFHEEATMLTAVECTCALPVAFGQAAQAGMLHGARSSVLGVLMVVGFVARVWLSGKLTVPRAVELYGAWAGTGQGAGDGALRDATGEVMDGSITAAHRVALVFCSVGLTALNVVWLVKITSGVWKVFRKRLFPTEAEKRERTEARAKARVIKWKDLTCRDQRKPDPLEAVEPEPEVQPQRWGCVSC